MLSKILLSSLLVSSATGSLLRTNDGDMMQRELEEPETFAYEVIFNFYEDGQTLADLTCDDHQTFIYSSIINHLVGFMNTHGYDGAIDPDTVEPISFSSSEDDEFSGRSLRRSRGTRWLFENFCALLGERFGRLLRACLVCTGGSCCYSCRNPDDDHRRAQTGDFLSQALQHDLEATVAANVLENLHADCGAVGVLESMSISVL